MPQLATHGLSESLLATREVIDAALLAALQFTPGCPERLAAAMRYSLLAPGKRLRPTLLLWGAEACGCEDWVNGLPAACAVEMIHTYSLIHDDLPAMDNDDLRRGQPTCHRAFDEATAILAGDGLLTLAFEQLTRLHPPTLAATACTELAKAAGPVGMVGGQASDLAAEGRFLTDPLPPASVEQLESIHSRKTGAMIRVSLKLGGMIAFAGREQLAALDIYGQKIGLAFQIADDLLDVQGSEVATGKRVGKDHNLGKMTYPTLCGIAESQLMANQLVDEAIAALAPFGNAGEKLEALARYVVERNH
ncbi:MAG: polyprenyl synthetase family protein [Pirellulales bacterium]|nr:polyprenyl synthetase family protein [Pirellulales bacterium]